MTDTLRPLLLAVALAIFPAAHAAAPAAAADTTGIAVTVHRDGAEIQTDVDFLVDATPQQAWDVLTDYDHMSEFVSTVVASRIISRTDGKFEVAQTVSAKFGPFGLKFDNVRQIEFTPLQEIRSKLVQGDMKSSVFTTRLTAENGATRVSNHGRFTPDRWVPPLIGTTVIEAQTRKQFAEFRAEILRRKNAAASNPH